MPSLRTSAMFVYESKMKYHPINGYFLLAKYFQNQNHFHRKLSNYIQEIYFTFNSLPLKQYQKKIPGVFIDYFWQAYFSVSARWRVMPCIVCCVCVCLTCPAASLRQRTRNPSLDSAIHIALPQTYIFKRERLSVVREQYKLRVGSLAVDRVAFHCVSFPSLSLKKKIAMFLQPTKHNLYAGCYQLKSITQPTNTAWQRFFCCCCCCQFPQ